MGSEEINLFPVYPVNQNNLNDGVVEVVPEVILGPSNGLMIHRLIGRELI